jgi:hypothetical protein
MNRTGDEVPTKIGGGALPRRGEASSFDHPFLRGPVCLKTISHKSCSSSGPRLNRAFPYQFELLRRLKLFPASVCFHRLLCSTGQKPGPDIAVLCRELVDPFAHVFRKR